MKKYLAFVLTMTFGFAQLVLACYSFQYNAACGPAAGTKFTLCPDAPDVVITAQGSKPYYADVGNCGDYQSLSGTASCTAQCKFYPCDGSPATDGSYVDPQNISKVPNTADPRCIPCA